MRDLFEKRHSPLISVRLLHRLHAPEGPSCGGARLGERQSAADVLVCEHLEVRSNLVIQIGVASRLVRECAEARQHHAQRGDHSSSSSRSISATVRAQLSVSAASCFRPARVIE